MRFYSLVVLFFGYMKGGENMIEINISEINFNQLSEEWLQFKKNQIKESTYLNYKFIIKSKFTEEFGKKSIEELLHYNFNLYISDLIERLESKTVKDIISILKSILKYAETKYDVNFKLNLVSSPSIYKKDIEIFTERERKRIEGICMKSNELKDLGILISLYAGLRIGEVCALKWKDINFESKCINVTHTLQRVYVSKKDTKIIYTTPKTRKSIRKIPLSKVLYAKLKDISKQYEKNAFVLTGDTDKWVEPLGYRYTYKLILKQSRVKYKKFHTLRHTFATRCVKVGMDTKSLSEILGHSNVNITLNIYVHSSFEIKNKYINKL